MTWAIYGAYGYTGRLVAELAVERGYRPLLLGRDPAALAAVAGTLGLEHAAVALDDTTALEAALHEVDLVVHCAGPFVHTSRQVVDACLATGTHYVDVTGEIDVLEAVLNRHQEAKTAAVALLPGSGFDVVPTDCLAAMVAAALPGADSLELAFRAGGGMSRGTTLTALESMTNGGRARVGGAIVNVPAGWKRRSFEFPSGSAVVSSIPWGDVSTATRSTGVGNVVTYTQVPLARLQPALAVLLKAPGARSGLAAIVRKTLTGPDLDARTHTRAEVVAEAHRGTAVVEAAMITPNGYALTADSVVRVVDRVLAGCVPAGAWTPSQAHGAEFVLELDGVSLERKPV
jgi:saccharopine dehydrogenase (NAD+, L-lysine-forming)